MSELDDFGEDNQIRQVYIGWDPREGPAFRSAWHSLLNRCVFPPTIHALVLKRLELRGLLRRPTRRIHGQLWDDISEAPMSTEFAISRFLTPILAQRGLALYIDCDVVFLADVQQLFNFAKDDPSKAVWVVKHGRFTLPAMPNYPETKMDGQQQTLYARKNWSSVMLFNCDHPKNLGLNLELINNRPGRDLHRFCWLDDHEIGTLPPEWNWLVGVQPKPYNVKLAHFTLGGPWLPNWKAQPYDDIWLDASKDS